MNVGRGTHIDSGRLAGIALDVFEDEPLPIASPFWNHPGVIVTPHIAAIASRQARAFQAAAAIVAYETGDDVPYLFDRKIGY